MKKTLYIVSLFLIAAIFSASAATYDSYPFIGAEYGYSQRGDSQWNTGMTSIYSYPYTLTSGGFIPLVDDVNNDGLQEVVAWDNGKVLIFSTPQLDLLGFYNTGSATNAVEMAIFDIDANNESNIIIFDSSVSQIRIFNVSNTSQISLWQSYGVSGEGVGYLKCGKTEECVVVTSGWQTSTGVPGGLSCPAFPGSDSEPVHMYVTAFNTTTSVSTDVQAQFSHFCSMNSMSYQKHLCFPRVRIMQYENYDASTSGAAYIFSGNEYSESYVIGNNYNAGANANERVHVYYVRINPSTKAATLSDHFEWNIGGLFGTQGTGKSCTTTSKTSTTGEQGYDIGSSAILFPIQTQSQNTLDTAFSYKKSQDTFATIAIDSTQGVIFDYPIANYYKGRFFGNPVRASAFPNGKQNDIYKNTEVCTLGYSVEYHAIDIACAGQQNYVEAITFNYKGVDFLWQLPPSQINITQSINVPNLAMHAVKTTGTTIDGINLDEFLTSFGVYQLSIIATDFEYPPESWSCTPLLGGGGRCTANQIFNAPVSYLAWTTADTQDSGWEDLIGLNDNGLWYIDDGYANQPPYNFCPSAGSCSNWTLNPCQTFPWNLSTNIILQIAPVDPDAADQVKARARLYYGTPYEQDSGWSAWKPNDGQAIPFTFIANQTISSGKFFMEIQGSGSSEIISNEVGYSVIASGGVTTYDCTGGSSVVTPSPINVTPTPVIVPPLPEPVNPISTAMKQIDDMFHLGSVVIWLIIMVAVAFGLWSSSSHDSHASSKMTLGIIMIAEVCMVFLGSYLGFIGIGLIIVFVIVGLLVLALMFRNAIASGG